MRSILRQPERSIFLADTRGCSQTRPTDKLRSLIKFSTEKRQSVIILIKLACNWVWSLVVSYSRQKAFCKIGGYSEFPLHAKFGHLVRWSTINFNEEEWVGSMWEYYGKNNCNNRLLWPTFGRRIFDWRIFKWWKFERQIIEGYFGKIWCFRGNGKVLWAFQIFRHMQGGITIIFRVGFSIFFRYMKMLGAVGTLGVL